MANRYKPGDVVNTMAQDIFNDGVHLACRAITNTPKVVKYVGEELFYGAITPLLSPTVLEGTKEWGNTESIKYRAGTPFAIVGLAATMLGIGYLAARDARWLVLPVITNASDFLYRRYKATKEKMERDE